MAVNTAKGYDSHIDHMIVSTTFTLCHSDSLEYHHIIQLSSPQIPWSDAHIGQALQWRSQPPPRVSLSSPPALYASSRHNWWGRRSEQWSKFPDEDILKHYTVQQQSIISIRQRQQHNNRVEPLPFWRPCGWGRVGPGSGGRLWMGREGSAPHERPHRKLEPIDTVFSLCKEVGVLFGPEFRLWME